MWVNAEGNLCFSDAKLGALDYLQAQAIHTGTTYSDMNMYILVFLLFSLRENITSEKS